MSRTITCQVLNLDRHGANRCTAEAVDSLGEILICWRHLAAVIELAGHLDGVSIILTAPARSAS